MPLRTALSVVIFVLCASSLSAQRVLVELPSLYSNSQQLSAYKLIDGDVLYEGPATPYAKEYAQSRGITLLHLRNAIGDRSFLNFSDENKGYFQSISSYRYKKDASWTFFRGRGMNVYELIKLSGPDEQGPPWVVVLHKDTSWYLSLVEGGTAMYYPKLLQKINLEEIAKSEASKLTHWLFGDFTETYLGVVNGCVRVVVTVTQSGSGTMPVEGLTFTFREQGNRLECTSVQALNMQYDPLFDPTK